MENATTVLTYMSHDANLCCPRGYEGLDPLQVHLDGFCIGYLLGPTQFKNHLQQKTVSAQAKYN